MLNNVNVDVQFMKRYELFNNKENFYIYKAKRKNTIVVLYYFIIIIFCKDLKKYKEYIKKDFGYNKSNGHIK